MIITTTLVREPYGAVTVWPFIFVLPSYRSDAALIAHEMVHYREQAWITPIWLLRYFLSRSFRMAAEVRAYKVQIALGGITPLGASQMLLTYDLDLTPEQALAAFTEGTP